MQLKSIKIFDNKGNTAICYVDVVWKGTNPLFLLHHSKNIFSNNTSILGANTWIELKEKLKDNGWTVVEEKL